MPHSYLRRAFAALFCGLLGSACRLLGAAPIVTSLLEAAATVGTAFSYTITGSDGPTSFGVTGTLPSGLSVGTMATVNDNDPSVGISYSGSSWSHPGNRSSYAN